MPDASSDFFRLSGAGQDDAPVRLWETQRSRADAKDPERNRERRQGAPGGDEEEKEPPRPSLPDLTLIAQADRLRLAPREEPIENPFFGLLSNRLHLGWPDPHETDPAS